MRIKKSKLCLSIGTAILSFAALTTAHAAPQQSYQKGKTIGEVLAEGRGEGVDIAKLEKVHVAENQNDVINGDLLFNGSSETPEEVCFCSLVNLSSTL